MAAMSSTVLAARAHGVAALDGVHLDLEDMDGFVEACEEGKAFGFDGKTIIHPKFVNGANLAFSPSEDEVQRSRRIVDAVASGGDDLVVVDGALVEALHVEQAANILRLHELCSPNTYET